MRIRRKIFFVLFMSTIFIAPSLFAEDDIISYLEGDVYIDHQGEDIYPDFGTPLFEGDRITTGPDGLAIIELKGGRILKLKENSILTLENIGQNSNLNLSKGALFARVKKLTSGSFSVSTEGVVAGVRGTQFFLSYGKAEDTSPDIWLCVNEGTVEVGLAETGESVLVQEGEGINIPSGSRLTDPRYYSWTEDLNWNTDPSSGSVKDSTTW